MFIKRLLIGIYKIAGRVLYKIMNPALMGTGKKNAQKKLKNIDRQKTVILIMCYSFYGGGAERVACRLANELSKEYSVVLLGRGHKNQTYDLDPQIPVILMPRFTGKTQVVYEQYAGYARWLKKELQVKASISFMFLMNMVNVMSRGNERVICSERNNPAKREPDNMPEIERIYTLADHVVFQTSTVRDLFSGKVKEHSSIIPNPTEVTCTRGVTRHRIVNVARLNIQKNQAMLIRAFASFHETHQEYTLSIYGDGELRSELEQQIRNLHLEGVVFLEGNVTNIHEKIADAEIFALSSDFEGMSNALLECMMMGMPCISTKCEGSTDIIKNGENGILTEIGSEEEMSKAMAFLADNPEIREAIGKKAAVTAESFKMEKIADKWKALI